MADQRELAEKLHEEGKHLVHGTARLKGYDNDSIANKEVKQGARAIKGYLSPAAQHAAALKDRPDHPKAVDMVREMVHKELAPDRAKQLAEEIIEAAHRHHGEAATDPATLMEFAKEQLVKEAVEREGTVKRHTLAAKVQSVTDKTLDTEHHGTPLVAKKVLEKMQEEIHEHKEE